MRGKSVSDQTPVPRPVSTTAGALWQEFEAIHGPDRPACTGQGHDGSLRDYYDAALQRNQAALLLGFLVMELAFVVAAYREGGTHRRLFGHNFGWWTLAS